MAVKEVNVRVQCDNNNCRRVKTVEIEDVPDVKFWRMMLREEGWQVIGSKTYCERHCVDPVRPFETGHRA